MAYDLKNPELTKSCQQRPFVGKVREGRVMVSCCKLLSVRSWSGHKLPVNLYQINAILCSDQKGQGSPLSPGPD